MDPVQLVEIVGAAIGGIAVIGGGGWAILRGRRRGGDGADRPTTERGTDRPAGATTTTTERPAAPTWSDTLSAPAPERERTSADRADESTLEVPVEPVDGASATTLETPETEQLQETAETAETAPAPTAPAEQPAEPEALTAAEAATAPPLETPEPAADRMVRLRDRLARSGSIGRGLLGLLSRDQVDEDTWDEIEETLLLADLGPDPTDELLAALRRRMQVLGSHEPAAVREVLREELVRLIDPAMDRRLAATRQRAEDGTVVPSAILMVGVNGTGKTTTVGKLARVLVAEGRTVVLGAADTFRAAAADQLATWGSRVGVRTVRSDVDGADPASVAFDAISEGIAEGVDVAIIDTAGRLQNKKGLMDELGKVRRVSEKALHGVGVREVLLVLDATTGQNGMQQARVFSEAVNITGIVLTKLDGTAKGGIVVNVQRVLGVPVKMVGLGEGMDDLAPFDPYGFVDALLGE